jgi:peptidoglycan/LPS O-acetylase OafA/YrhL
MINTVKQVNSLNTVRLLGAVQVLYGHTLAHLRIDSIPVVGYFISFFYGVPIFFTMSGF